MRHSNYNDINNAKLKHSCINGSGGMPRWSERTANTCIVK
jgi:hypothetical protein